MTRREQDLPIGPLVELAAVARTLREYTDAVAPEPPGGLALRIVRSFDVAFAAAHEATSVVAPTAGGSPAARKLRLRRPPWTVVLTRPLAAAIACLLLAGAVAFAAATAPRRPATDSASPSSGASPSLPAAPAAVGNDVAPVQPRPANAGHLPLPGRDTTPSGGELGDDGESGGDDNESGNGDDDGPDTDDAEDDGDGEDEDSGADEQTEPDEPGDEDPPDDESRPDEPGDGGGDEGAGDEGGDQGAGDEGDDSDNGG